MTKRDELLSAVESSVRAYCDAEHDFRFKANDPVVRLHEPTFSTDEIMAAVECLLSTKVTMGPKVVAFEKEFCGAFNFAHGVMNNSGSSANLLAVAALANPAARDGLKPGDEVIVPALCWSTTVWPLIQLGLVPVFVDMDPETLNIDPEQIERAIGPKTRAVMLVHVYGNPCDMDAIVSICNKRNLILIEDCCEALAATYGGKAVGTIGRVGTFSFYFSHHMTTLEGGICVTDDFELAELMRILRAHGWVRETENRDAYLKQYPDFDPRFLFVNLGYNLRATELQGAIGSVQLPKLAGFVDARRENTAAWKKDLARFGEFLAFQQETPKGRSSCFGFPMTLTDKAPFNVRDLMAHLNKARIETRPIIAGNMAAQPGLKLYQHRIVGDLPHSSWIMHNGITFGNHQAVDAKARDYVTGHVESFFKAQGLI